MPHRIRPSLPSGWTLLELMVAIAVALLIVGMGAAVFRIPNQSLARLAGPAHRDAEAFRIFREDLASLAALPGSILPALVLTPPDPTTGDPLVLELVCARRNAPATDPRDFALFSISHRFEPDPADPTQRRWLRRSRKGSDELARPREEILTEGIETITVEAWTGTAWTNRWTDTRKHNVPVALRIDLHRGEQIQTLVAPIPAGFTAEPERASPTSGATSGQGDQRIGARQTGAPPNPVR